jgi:hypothetical protein
VGISATVTGVGGWTVGPVVGRRPAGVARDAVHPGTGARAVLVIVDDRFTGRGLPDPETVARAAVVGSPAVMPMLDAGLLEDGTRWYVTPASPGPVLDPAAGCSPRRVATLGEAVARALAAVHAAGLVHGLVGAQTVVPAAGRHLNRPVGTTLLLDTGVAALLGDRADDLAAAAGVSLPADRGQAADVHALGALLLRMLTAAAPAGPALSALPVELRALLSAMLDERPAARPTADAVARSLAGLREGLLGTGPLELQAPAAVVDRRPIAAPTPAPVPLPVARPLSTPSAVIAPRLVVPAPVRAPHTIESPILVPRPILDAAPSLWTGSVPIAVSARRPRRRGRRILMLVGGVGLAGLLVGIVTHLPLGHVDGDQAAAAVADHRLLDASTGSVTGSSSAVTAAAKPSHSATATATAATTSPVRTTAVTPAHHAAAASSTTASRTTAPVRRSTGSRASSAPVSSAPAAASSTPSGTSSSATTATTTPPAATVPASSTPSPTPTDTTAADTTPTDTSTSTPAAS